MTFGNSQGGGRRLARRVNAFVPALLVTTSQRRSAGLLDLSRSGAQLRLSDPPQARERNWLCRCRMFRCLDVWCGQKVNDAVCDSTKTSTRSMSNSYIKRSPRPEDNSHRLRVDSPTTVGQCKRLVRALSHAPGRPAARSYNARRPLFCTSPCRRVLSLSAARHPS